MDKKGNPDDFEILYENTIAINSKTKSTKVIIVDHMFQKCIEIVAYNAHISLDTARLYLNAVLLVEKINCLPDFAIKMTTTIEAREASSQPFDFQSFRKDLVKTYIIKYILERLDVPKNLARGTFSIEMKILEGDLKDSHHRLDVVRNMPPNLKQYEFENTRKTNNQHHDDMKAHDHKNDTNKLPSLGRASGGTFGHEGNRSLLHDHHNDHKQTNDHSSVHVNGATTNGNGHNVSNQLSAVADSKYGHRNSTGGLAPITSSHGLSSASPMGARALLKKQGSMDDSIIMENTNRSTDKKFSPRFGTQLDSKNGSASANGSTTPNANGATPTSSSATTTDSQVVVDKDDKKSVRRVMKRQSSIQELIDGKNINNLPPLANRRGSLSKQNAGSNSNIFIGNKLTADELSGSEDEGESDKEEGSSGRENAPSGLNNHTTSGSGKKKNLLSVDHMDHIHGLKLATNLPGIEIPAEANALIDAPSKRDGHRKSLGNIQLGAIKNFKRQFDVVQQMTDNLNLRMSAIDPSTPSFARQTLTSLIQISDEKTHEQRRRSMGDVPSRRILQPLSTNSDDSTSRMRNESK